MYYEIHGAGEPLILLHGGVGSTESFSEIMPSLSNSRQVIAVDLQAHGRTADIDRPLSFEAMADDIAALMKYLGDQQGGCDGLLAGRRHGPVHRYPASRSGEKAGGCFGHLQA